VTFRDGSKVLGTGTVVVIQNRLAQATLILAGPLDAGTHTLFAIYNGDSDLNVSPLSQARTLTVSPAHTSTKLTSSLNPAFAGQPILLTAVVSSPDGTPGGSVTFFNGSTVLKRGVALKDGMATLVVTNLPASATPYTLKAVYSASGNFDTSSDTVNQIVKPDQALQTTTVSSSPTSSLVAGQLVQLTATVTSTTSVSGWASGTVTFMDGKTVLGTAPLQVVDGIAQASFMDTAGLLSGSHTITAVYAGDSSFKSSTSAGLPMTVSQAATATVVSSFSDPSVSGQSATFLITVFAAAPSSGLPAGAVKVSDGTNSLDTVTLSPVGGLEQAKLTVNTLETGTHTISAVYSPTSPSDFAASTSAPLTQVVVTSLAQPTGHFAARPARSPLSSGKAGSAGPTADQFWAQYALDAWQAPARAEDWRTLSWRSGSLGDHSILALLDALPAAGEKALDSLFSAGAVEE
jgi:hypothetical protein